MVGPFWQAFPASAGNSRFKDRETMQKIKVRLRADGEVGLARDLTCRVKPAHGGAHRRKAFQAIFAACVLSGVVSETHAQEGLDSPDIEVQRTGQFNIQRFGAAPGPRNFLTTRTVRTDGEHAFSVGAMANFAYEPLVIQLSGEVCQDRDDCNTRAVQTLVALDLMPTYTPIPQIQIGLRVPLTYAYGQGMTIEGLPERNRDMGIDGIDTFAISDPELEAKFRFYGTLDTPVAVGAAIFGTAPIGKAMAKDNFVGSDSFTGGGRLIFDAKFSILQVAVNAGYRYQKSAQIVSKLGSEGIVSVAAGANLAPTIRILADAFASSQFGSEPGTNTAEVGIAAQFSPPMSPWAVTLGGGPGLIKGAIGVPLVRAYLGVSYTYENRDDDGDGIVGASDFCPASAEDMDDFEDQDGCPDVDNDGDVITDAADKCPNDAEDTDEFEDLDGCPETDNDKDGVPDDQDRCPKEPEALNGFDDEDGCPDIKDSDRDGLADDKDKCVTEAEDTDGFEDTDGCPDLDNDGDGIPDTQDECGDQAENVNGEKDEDGCPEEVLDLD
jgi:OmpA-OmpF porin, OOP family